jgi:hypothetical protein
MKKYLKGDTVVRYIYWIFFVLISNGCSYGIYGTNNYAKTNISNDANTTTNTLNHKVIITRHKPIKLIPYTSPYSTLNNNNNCRHNYNCKSCKN